MQLKHCDQKVYKLDLIFFLHFNDVAILTKIASLLQTGTKRMKCVPFKIFKRADVCESDVYFIFSYIQNFENRVLTTEFIYTENVNM